MRSVLSRFERYLDLTKKLPPDILTSLENVTNPGRFADIIASHLAIKIEDKQRILETICFKNRLEVLFQIITQEIEILEIEKN